MPTQRAYRRRYGPVAARPEHAHLAGSGDADAVPAPEGYDMEDTRLAMDTLSPEGHLLAAVQGTGPRECWRALVPAIDAYFNALN
jgi:hypothetical protein